MSIAGLCFHFMSQSSGLVLISVLRQTLFIYLFIALQQLALCSVFFGAANVPPESIKEYSLLALTGGQICQDSAET